MSNIKELTMQDFKEYVSNNDVVVVDFWAPWCGPCRALAPTIDSLAKKFENKVKFAKLNVDEATQIAVEYKVASIPNVCVFKNGQLVDRSVGFVPESNLEQLIGKHV